MKINEIWHLKPVENISTDEYGAQLSTNTLTEVKQEKSYAQVYFQVEGKDERNMLNGQVVVEAVNGKDTSQKDIEKAVTEHLIKMLGGE